MMKLEQLVRLFDHTFLKPYAAREDMERLCGEARQYGFAMVAGEFGAVGPLQGAS